VLDDLCGLVAVVAADGLFEQVRHGYASLITRSETATQKYSACQDRLAVPKGEIRCLFDHLVGGGEE
jgi:hypothetical protein